jgi:uncharacterized protein YbaA (DUF1428 family)
MKKNAYVDGFLLAVPKNKVQEYIKMAEEAKNLWLRHGALDYKECIGDDLNPMPPEGVENMKTLSFEEATNTSVDETVWFSFIVFKSREHRDEVNAKVMKDMKEEMAKLKDTPMPFDMKRVFYGGFKVEVGN